ncbi:MAG: universal stress protein [Nitrospirota bacterium]
MCYIKIFIPVDNSEYSNYSVEIGASIAERSGAQLIGCHVYNASLHDRRFKDMEPGLPEHYQQEERLKRSRMIHNSLIGEGLHLISDAYLDIFEKRCVEAGIQFTRKLMEGKNWFETVKDVRNNHYDLIIMGIRGLGAVNGNHVGSVCERVVRRVNTDVLVVKNNGHISERVVVGIDGSDHSYSALGKALALGKLFDLEIEAASAYDPNFHRRAFKGLVGVLSEDVGKRFRFKEQERLHDEVIDKGLKKVYEGYLNKASAIGSKEGFEIKTTLLAGKPYHEIYRYLKVNPPSLLVVSRFGAHQAEEPEIGNTAENLLRLSPCNILITNSAF